LRAAADAAQVTALAARAQRLFARIGRMKAPAISAVDGYALGGGNELQMACAWRVAGARTELGQPEINLHVIPGFGGTQMLPRLAARRARAGGGEMYSLLVDAVLTLEARRFGELTASDDGRAGIDRFFARRSWPLPARRDDA